MIEKAPGRLLTFMRKHCTLLFGLGAFFLLAWLLTGTSCTFHSTIGLPCPGCGLTRALLTALRGDLAGAWRLHPLFWLAPLVLAAVILMLAVAPERLSVPAMNRLWLTLALLFVVVYLIRMVLYFPEQEPLTWNDQAILPRIWRLLKAGYQAIFP